MSSRIWNASWAALWPMTEKSVSTFRRGDEAVQNPGTITLIIWIVRPCFPVPLPMPTGKRLPASYSLGEFLSGSVGLSNGRRCAALPRRVISPQSQSILKRRACST